MRCWQATPSVGVGEPSSLINCTVSPLICAVAQTPSHGLEKPRRETEGPQFDRRQ